MKGFVVLFCTVSFGNRFESLFSQIVACSWDKAVAYFVVSIEFFSLQHFGSTALRLSVLQLLSSSFGAVTSCRGRRLSLSCVVVLLNCFVMNGKQQTETKHGNKEVIF